MFVRKIIQISNLIKKNVNIYCLKTFNGDVILSSFFILMAVTSEEPTDLVIKAAEAATNNPPEPTIITGEFVAIVILVSWFGGFILKLIFG